MRNLLSDLNNYAWPAKWRYASETVNSQRFLWLELALASYEFYVKAIFSMGIYVKIFISIVVFFLVFKHDFIRCVDFTRIAASDTASDDVTN